MIRERENNMIKLVVFRGHVSLLPRTCIITRPHNVDPTSKFSSASHSETYTHPHRIQPQETKTKKPKKREKERRLTTRLEGANCPQPPPLVTLTSLLSFSFFLSLGCFLIKTLEREKLI